MSDPITWEDLDDMVEGDPLKLRDRAWREIRTRDMELAGLRELRAEVVRGLSPWLRDGEPPEPDDSEVMAAVECVVGDHTDAANGLAAALADIGHLNNVLERLRAVAVAARDVRDWSVRSYGKSETELGGPLFALRAALAVLDGES